MSLSSQLAMEDVGSLFLGPSSLLMDDPLGPLLDDEEEPLSEGCASPHSFSSYADSSSSSSSPFPCLSPPPSPPTLLGSKADLLPSLPWLSADELLNAQISAESCKEDAFSGMDWMTEKIDLNDFDLDSLIGSYESDESPSSPEELLASLESHMELDMEPLPFPDTSAPADDLALSSPLPEDPAPTVIAPVPESEPEPEVAIVPEPAALEIEIKSEPSSPAPSPLPATFTLELGSEVDVSELEKMVAPVVATATPDALQGSSIVLSLSPSHIVVVLASPKEELSPPPSSCEEQSDSDSGIGSDEGSPPRSVPSPRAGGSSRTKPYSKPDPDAADSPVGGKVKTVSGAPKVVEKKLKKMEQNKTAATRYRQKKRVEQDQLNSECADLEKRNRELADKADSISREIQYLKDLLEEVRSAKNRKTKGTTA